MASAGGGEGREAVPLGGPVELRAVPQQACRHPGSRLARDGRCRRRPAGWPRAALPRGPDAQRRTPSAVGMSSRHARTRATLRSRSSRPRHPPGSSATGSHPPAPAPGRSAMTTAQRSPAPSRPPCLQGRPRNQIRHRALPLFSSYRTARSVCNWRLSGGQHRLPGLREGCRRRTCPRAIRSHTLNAQPIMHAPRLSEMAFQEVDGYHATRRSVRTFSSIWHGALASDTKTV